MQFIGFFHRAHWRRKIYTCCPSEGWTSGRLGCVQKQGVTLSNMLWFCSEWVSECHLNSERTIFSVGFLWGRLLPLWSWPFHRPIEKVNIWQKYLSLKDILRKWNTEIWFTNVIQMHRARTTVARLPDMTDVGRQRMKKWGTAYLPLIKVLAFLIIVSTRSLNQCTKLLSYQLDSGHSGYGYQFWYP